MQEFEIGDKKLVDKLKSGAVGVIPTDTVYGVVCSALDEKSVKRMYEICRRDWDKRFVIVIADVEDLGQFGVLLDKNAKKKLGQLWPGKVSVVLGCKGKQLDFLLRGKSTLAFRLPEHEQLRALLRKSGPLATTSANPQGKEPSRTIGQAKKYFQREVDFYVNGGKLDLEPSTIIRFASNGIEIIRQGAAIIPNNN